MWKINRIQNVKINSNQNVKKIRSQAPYHWAKGSWATPLGVEPRISWYTTCWVFMHTKAIYITTQYFNHNHHTFHYCLSLLKEIGGRIFHITAFYLFWGGFIWSSIFPEWLIGPKREICVQSIQEKLKTQSAWSKLTSYVRDRTCNATWLHICIK